LGIHPIFAQTQPKQKTAWATTNRYRFDSQG
jgi:hypothetical protein